MKSDETVSPKNVGIFILLILAMLVLGGAGVLAVFGAIVWTIYPDTKPEMVLQFEQWWRVNVPGPPSIDTLLVIGWASVMWVLLDLRGLLQEIREELKQNRKRLDR